MGKSRKAGSWANAVSEARNQLGLKGFVAINKGSDGKQLYNLAKEIHEQNGGFKVKVGGGEKKKKGSWTQAISRARHELGLTGFVAINKGAEGKQLYNLAKQIHDEE